MSSVAVTTLIVNKQQPVQAEEESPVMVFNKSKTASPKDWIKDAEKQGECGCFTAIIVQQIVILPS